MIKKVSKKINKVQVQLYNDDCLNTMKGMFANSVTGVLCDPPYGLKFMGKNWDYGIPGTIFWKEVFRILKPGGYLLAFGGTRTYHRLTCAIEDSGFNITDCLMWLYGSGFPKSHNISKAIGITLPVTDEAKQWNGYSNALKPAWEPIVVAQKPCEGTYAKNALMYGVAGLNIDGCRIKTNDDLSGGTFGGTFGGTRNKDGGLCKAIGSGNKGRWPANLILDEEAGELLDKQTGELGKSRGGNSNAGNGMFAMGQDENRKNNPCGFGDTGGASRFFYCSKVSKSERDAGCEDITAKQYSHDGRNVTIENAYQRNNSVASNNHPTIKPISLMRYLVKLLKQPKYTKLIDPFMGSGTTGIACVLEGVSFIGIEKDKSNSNIAKRRIKYYIEKCNKK